MTIHAVRYNKFILIFRAACYLAIMAILITVVGVIVKSFVTNKKSKPDNFQIQNKLKSSKANIDYNKLDITISNLLMRGFSADNLPFKVEALKGIKFKDNIFKMDDINFTYEMAGGDKVNIKSATGIYDKNNELIKLGDDIYLNGEDYTIKLKDAKIDLNQSTVKSDKDIKLESSKGEIKANAVEADYKDNIVKLKGGVKAILNVE